MTFSRGAPDTVDLEVIGEHRDLLDELLDQDALLRVGGFAPERVYVQVGERDYDLLETGR